MRHKFLSALIAGTAIIAVPSLAHAEDFSLHLEPGMAAPMSAPQSTLYNPGVVLGAKGMFAINNNLSLGPSVSSLYLPRAVDDGQNAGVMWQVGGSFRVEGNRSNPDVLWSPWIDLDAMLAHTGDLWRPAFDVGVGIEGAFDQAHTFWMGPFVRYTHLFQTSDWQSGVALDRRDVNMIQAGLSFSFDFPTRVREHTTVERHTAYVVIHDPAPVAVVSPPADHFELTEKVYFDFDKATLRWESRDKLEALIKKLNQHPNVRITIDGHASADGQLLHNQVLSAQRTAAVRDYLAANGVEPSRLIGLVHGISQPAASNVTQEGRERNRRVEFTVIITSQDSQ